MKLCVYRMNFKLPYPKIIIRFLGLKDSGKAHVCNGIDYIIRLLLLLHPCTDIRKKKTLFFKVIDDSVSSFLIVSLFNESWKTFSPPVSKNISLSWDIMILGKKYWLWKSKFDKIICINFYYWDFTSVVITDGPFNNWCMYFSFQLRFCQYF